MGQLEEVCEELDRVLLELMAFLQQLAETRKKYSAAVSEGYFNMAKARYAMGPTSVGVLQYDAVMSPLVHVETAADLTHGEESEFKIKRIQPGKLEVDESRSAETQLRRRRPTSGEQENSSVEDLPPKEGSVGVRGGEVEEEAKDPLMWFGILLPQSLRRSQQYFVQAVSHCTELATTQMRVEALRRKYHKLLLEKRRLKEEQTLSQT